MPSWWRIQGGYYVAHRVLFIVNKKGDGRSAPHTTKRRRAIDTLESGYAACTAILAIGKTSVGGQVLDLSHHRRLNRRLCERKPWCRGFGFG